MAKSLTAALLAGFRPRAETTVLSGVPLTDHSFWRGWAGNSSFTGQSVSVDNALRLATPWACIHLISETIATLPFGFYERKANGSRTTASNHDLYEILHNQPNAEQTAMLFWQVVIASMLAWGNAYVEINRNVRGGVTALKFLYPSRVTIRRTANGSYEYVYLDQSSTASTKERVIPESKMMHIPAFSTDGVMGLSPIAFGANVFGTAIETDKASAETFKNALRSPGLLRMDMTLSKTQREELRAHVKSVSDTGGVMVMEKGAGFDKLGFDPVSAELLASRAWNVEEMCRWYGVDPSMIGHGAKDSNWGTGLEQKMLWFVTLTLRKWCVRIEQAVRKSLLSPAERAKYFAEFNIEGLLRGDSAGRAAYLSVMGQNGYLTRNEGRAKENLPPLPGGDVLTVQSNLVPIDRLGDNIPDPSTTSQTEKGISNLHNEIRVLSAFLNKPQPPQVPPVFNVDARTTVEAAPAPNVTVNIPERAAPDVTVDARTTINPAASPVTVNVPEARMPDVRIEAPITVNQPAAENHVHVDGLEHVADATKELNATMKKPMKPVYKDGKLVGGERVEKL